MKTLHPVHSLPPLPSRLPDSHKGTYGKVLLVAGSRGMAGAAVLAARAALRGGAGLVTVAVPASLANALAIGVPEATQTLLPELDVEAYRKELLGTLEADLDSAYQAVGIGPGIRTGPSSRDLLELVLSRRRGPHVVDADGLTVVSAGAEVRPSDERIWTPHPGEFRRLAATLPQGDDERVRAGQAFVEKYRGVLLLKGHRTVVTDGQRYFLNLTGNAGMATGGSGDVLTGLITSLLAQGLEPFAAACLGAHLHGLAGDFAARSLSRASVTAGDLVEYLPKAITEYERATP